MAKHESIVTSRSPLFSLFAVATTKPALYFRSERANNEKSRQPKLMHPPPSIASNRLQGKTIERTFKEKEIVVEAIGNGGAVKKVDDSGGDDMDTGIYGDELRLLVLLVGSEVGAWDIAGPAKLPLGGLRYGEGIRVVFRGVSYVLPCVGCHVHGCFLGALWLWPPVACHSESRLFALFPG
jgi:hypothetical protein